MFRAFRAFQGVSFSSKMSLYRGFGQSPYDILGLDPNGLTLDKLTSKYKELVKKHHPDVSKEQDAKEKFIEIKQSYELLKATAQPDGTIRGNSPNYRKKEEEASEDAYNYNKRDHYFYKSGFSEQPQAPKSGVENTIAPLFFLIIPLIGIACVGYSIYWTHKNEREHHEKEEKRKKFSSEDIARFRERGWQRERNIVQKKVDKVYSEIPEKILKYPKPAPQTFEMLMDYTIWKDIKVYFLPDLDLDSYVTVSKAKSEMPRCQIDNIRESEYITFALEAERAMSHVLIDV